MSLLCKFADNKPLLIGILAGIVGLVIVAMIVNAVQQRRENKRAATQIKPEDIPFDDETRADAEAVDSPATQPLPDRDSDETLNAGCARKNADSQEEGSSASAMPACPNAANDEKCLTKRTDKSDENGKPLDNDDWSEL